MFTLDAKELPANLRARIQRGLGLRRANCHGECCPRSGGGRETDLGFRVRDDDAVEAGAVALEHLAVLQRLREARLRRLRVGRHRLVLAVQRLKQHTEQLH